MLYDCVVGTDKTLFSPGECEEGEWGFLAGKTVLLTGATRGLGEGIVRQLCTTPHKPARVLLLARAEPRAKALCADLEAAGISAKSYLASLDSMKQVFEVGAAISLQESQLHVVVLCHGEQPDERVLQSEGLESSYALNYLSNVVLIEQLKPLLARSAPARICVFGTHSATWISKGWLKTALLNSTALPEGEDIPGDFAGSHVPGARERLWCYSQVGLAKQYYVAAAPEAEGHLPSGVTINCTAPGPTPTDAPGWKEMVRATGTGVLYRLLGWLYGWRDVATGCQSMLVLMGSPVMTGVTGQILDFGYGGPLTKRRPIPAHRLFRRFGTEAEGPDEAMAKAMCQELMQSTLAQVKELQTRYGF